MAGIITKDHLKKALTYSLYIELTDRLLAQNKTTGEDHSPKMVEYTLLNRKRISRIEKQVKLLPELVEELQNLKEKWYWIVLAEAWCGDVAQNLPVIRTIVDAAPTIELLILLRDQNPDVMNAHLTNGGKSIPKLICLKHDTLVEVGTWGPRPAPVQQLVIEHKANPEEDYSKFVEKVHNWYSKDKGITIQKELLALIHAWKTV